jgi:hypothetical protein
MSPVSGSCHCGAVRFEVETDLSRASRCNCTICQRTGATSVIVKPAQFTLRSGKEMLASYSRMPEVASRFFCKQCGIHCYGAGTLEEIGGDFVSVNANCFDAVDPNVLPLVYWDGRHDNWQGGPKDRPWPVHADAARATA